MATSRLPQPSDLAALIREGYDCAELATSYGVSQSTIRQRILKAGWSSETGQPLVYVPPVDEDLVALVKAFVFPVWFDDANCLGTDPEAFFPEKGGSTRQAKAVCGRCDVAAECLDWALDSDERFGIFGGLSERERRRIKKALEPEQHHAIHDTAIGEPA